MTAAEKPQTEAELKRSLDFQLRLNKLTQQLHEGGPLAEVMPKIMPELLKLLEAERVTLYQRGRNDSEIVSRFKVNDGLNEIRVPLSPASISGYVALTQKALVIRDVYDEEELKRINPQLTFNKSFDRQSGFRTRSMVVLPIKADQVMLGVLQVINHQSGGSFTREHALNALRVAQVLAQKLRYELNSTRGPFDLLVQRHYLDEGQLKEVLARARQQKVSAVQLLREDLRIPMAAIGTSLEHYYQVPYFPYNPEVQVPKALISGLSEAYLRRQLWVPVAGERTRATVLVDDPADTEKLEEIQRLLRAESYVFVVGLPDDILAYLGVELAPDGVSSGVRDLVGKLNEQTQAQELSGSGAAEEAVGENEATVVQLVNRLIEEAWRSNASDIHIEPCPGDAPVQVRVRVDGACQPLLELPRSHLGAVVGRIKVMSRLDITERRKPQDGKLMLRVQGRPLELRVATIPTVNGEEIVMRLLAAAEPLPLDRLNLRSPVDQALRQLLGRPHGIFLVVGPTGSGKTTTLHAVLGHINTPERKIWTAEDPVEITQKGLHQVQINPKIGLSFANALRAFLRADPDVIMIGEMRDAETAQAGVEASLTGHLVLSTLHTNSAPETVVRLLDLGIDPINFADALIGVLAQRLVRTLCPHCKRAEIASADEILRLKQHYGEEMFGELGVDEGNLKLHRAVGCDKCGHTGYRGRTGIHELLVATPEVQRLIYTSATASELKKQAMAQGMRTLRQDGIAKMLAGQIDYAQLLRTVGD